jgi:hypothetical protein
VIAATARSRFFRAVQMSSCIARCRLSPQEGVGLNAAGSAATTESRYSMRAGWPILVLYWCAARRYLAGREPMMRISTNLLALACQSGAVATLETPIRARSKSMG